MAIVRRPTLSSDLEQKLEQYTPRSAMFVAPCDFCGTKLLIHPSELVHQCDSRNCNAYFNACWDCAVRTNNRSISAFQRCPDHWVK